MKAAIEHTQTNWCGCILIKLQKRMVEFVDPALVEEDLESSPLISGPWLFHPKDEGVGLGDFLGPFQFCIFFKKLR